MAEEEAGVAVYQLHARSWLRRTPRRGDRTLDLDDPAALDEALATRLVPYVRGLGFTAIELLAADTPAELPRFAERCAASGLTLLPYAEAWRASPLAADAGDVEDRAWRFATLRARLATDWAQPGPRHLAMGEEFAQPGAPGVDAGLAWHLLADPLHEGLQRLVHDLNHLGTALISLVASNLSTTAQRTHRVGVALPGRYVERIATASTHYGGSEAAWPNGSVASEPVPWGEHPHSLVLNLPALSTSIFEGPR